MLGPIVPPRGPCPARIAIVGEAPGSDESDAMRPFVGASGRELARMLAMVGVNLNDCFLTNVFSRQPPGNNLGFYGVECPSPVSKALGPITSNPQLYCADEHLPELDRLRGELDRANPNVVLALGNTACWALFHSIGVGGLRGTVASSDFLGPDRPPLKVVPTFHPTMVLRQWDFRTIVVQDLEKAVAESWSPSIQYDNTQLWLCPTLDDMAEFEKLHLASASETACDIETRRGQITCVSFAPTPLVSICVPFWPKSGEPNYWPTLEEELAARMWVNRQLAKPSLIKIFQNGLYDLQYLLLERYTPVNCTEDTMIAHHSLYSELRKGLGFLGSIYANRPGWKDMAHHKKEEQLKRDD